MTPPGHLPPPACPKLIAQGATPGAAKSAV